MLTSTDACRLVDLVFRITEVRQGVKPGFEEGDVLRAMLEMARVPRGRLWLAKNLGIGEASARTLLRRLREEGLISVDKVAGAELTDKGRRLIASLLVSVHVSMVDAPRSLKDWGKISLIVVRNLARFIDTYGVIKLRDLAVSCGASAALIAACVGGRITIPAVDDPGLAADISEVLRKTRVGGDRLILLLKGGLKEAYRTLFRLLEELCGEM